MKMPEEQWKTIEEFPDYEISNFGNCRNRKTGKEKKKRIVTCRGKKYFSLIFIKNKVKYERRAARFVADYFVENPNNFVHTVFLDGNQLNISFMNQKWDNMRNIFPIYRKRKTFFCISEDELYEKYERGISLATKLFESVKNNSVALFVSENIPGICMKLLNSRYGDIRTDEKEYIVEFVTEMFLDRTDKKYAIVSVENFVRNCIQQYFTKKKESRKVQYNDNIHGKGGYGYDND